MNEGKIAVRYAKALFEAASDQGILEAVREDVDALQLLDNKVPGFRDLLESPVLNTEQKNKIFSILFEHKLEKLSYKFVLLMSKNKRESFIPSACRVFYDLYKDKKGIKAAKLTTAGLMHESMVLRMKESLESHYKCIIELETKTKADIIGGFILRVDDQQLDASVSSQLKKIKKGLESSIIS